MIDVLFVDDEQFVLDGLRRQFRPMRSRWTMRFADSADAASTMMSAQPADIVVSDMRMPGRDGVDLLLETRQRWPQTVRVILSGHTDQQQLYRGVGAVHQFLQKPCDPATIARAIDRTFAWRARVPNQRLLDLVSGLGSLPMLPETFDALVERLGDDTLAIKDACVLLGDDPGIAAKILQLARSPFFGSCSRIESVHHACCSVGLSTLRQTLLSQAFGAVYGGGPLHDQIASLWRSAACIADAARRSALTSDLGPAVADRAHTAGLLAVVGRAILLQVAPADFTRAATAAAARAIPLWAAEAELCGASQQSIGGVALGLWGLDDDIVEAVFEQATPSRSSVDDRSHPLVHVHRARCAFLGDALCDQLTPDESFLGRVGLSPMPVEMDPRRIDASRSPKEAA